MGGTLFRDTRSMSRYLADISGEEKGVGEGAHGNCSRKDKESERIASSSISKYLSDLHAHPRGHSTGD